MLFLTPDMDLRSLVCFRATDRYTSNTVEELRVLHYRRAKNAKSASKNEHKYVNI